MRLSSLRSHPTPPHLRRPGIDDDDDDDYVGAGLGTWTTLRLNCYMMIWDGEHLHAIAVRHRIGYFPGEKRVTDLDFYPLRFLPDMEDRLKLFRDRGELYLSYLGHKQYEGSNLQPPPLQDLFDYRALARVNPYRPVTDIPEVIRPTKFQDISSDVYIDIQSFFRTQLGAMADHKLVRYQPNRRETVETQPGYRERDISLGDQEVDDARTEAFFSSHRHLAHPTKLEAVEDSASVWQLLPPQIPAYVFRSRKWSEFCGY